MEQKSPNRFIQFCNKHAFHPKSIMFFAMIIFLIIVVFCFLTIQRTSNVSKTTKFGLEDIGELATQAGYFTTVQTISKSRDIAGWEIPLTQSNYVYSYDGIIKAGIDFAKIDKKVDEENHIITVCFPEFKILSIEIDENSFKLYNDGTNLFTTLHVEDVNKSNAELKKEAKETALKNGILENARTNAEVLIRGFYASMYDLSEYKIEFLPEVK